MGPSAALSLPHAAAGARPVGWQVSRAVDLATGEEVALKHVFPQRQGRGCAPAPCNLARELAALQALRHANILALRAVLPQARAPQPTVSLGVEPYLT